MRELFYYYSDFTDSKQEFAREWCLSVTDKVLDFGARHGMDRWHEEKWRQFRDEVLECPPYLPDFPTAEFGAGDLSGAKIYFHFDVDYRDEEPLRNARPDFDVGWSLFSNSSPERAAMYANLIIEVAKLAKDIARDARVFIAELRPGLLDEAKVEARKEAARRRHLDREIENGKARLLFQKEILPEFLKEAPEKTIRMELKGHKRKLAAEMGKLVKVEHERGQPSYLALTNLGLQHARQIQADKRPEAP